MPQYAWVLEVRPGYEEEYRRRHDAIWPEMVDALRKAGIRNYSIFRHGLTLFGYFETDDLDATIAALKDDPVNARWSEWMAPIMRIEIDTQRGFPFLLPLQWHMDGGWAAPRMPLSSSPPASSGGGRGQAGVAALPAR